MQLLPTYGNWGSLGGSIDQQFRLLLSYFGACSDRGASVPVLGLWKILSSARRPAPASEAGPSRQLAGHDTEEVGCAGARH